MFNCSTVTVTSDPAVFVVDDKLKALNSFILDVKKRQAFNASLDASGIFSQITVKH